MSELYPQSVHVTVEKLLKALNCLLVENFTIQDKTLLEKLLTSLQNADVLLKTIPTETHCNWFSKVMNLYQLQKSSSKKPSMHLYAFALKYLAILVKCSDRLVELAKSNTIQLIINTLNVKSNIKESSIFNAYMALLQSLNTHKEGVEYVFQESLWECILFAIHGLHVPAKYIEIQSSQYFADLIYTSFEYKIAHCCEPLFSELFFNFNMMNRNIIANKQVKDLVVHSVHVKTLILTLEKFIGTPYESDALQKIIVNQSLSYIFKNIKKLFDINPILLKNYITLHFLFDYFTVWNQSDAQCILKSIFSYMNIPKETQLYKRICNLYIQAIRYAHTSNSTLAVNAAFEKELIIGQLIPLKKCTEWLKCFRYKEFGCSDIIESKYILNYCNNHDSIMNEIAISSILNIIDIVPMLKQESLEYLDNFFSKLLKQFLNSNGWLNENLDQDSTNKKFLEILSYVFICWTKILECKLFIDDNQKILFTMPFNQCYYKFFHKPCHNTSILQNGLKLNNAAINKVFHHNLMGIRLYTDFEELCEILNDLLLDPRPEIRDCCLQCISSIVAVRNSSIIITGQPTFKMILEKNLPTAVLNTLEYDNDPFVRCKALECLESMVSVLNIWESSLKESNLIAHCINLMEYESEGIIRRQVVKLISALFFKYQLSYELCNVICIVMVHVSTKDPLWEVKTFAYDFWDSVIQNMIRKYSKKSENEKLTDNNFILRELSSIGCLHVFYVALKEEHDLVVQKKAVNLTKKILDSVNTTDFNHVTNEPVNCSNSIDIVIQNDIGPKLKKSRHIDSADRVLSSISTSDDCELLSNLKIDHNDSIYPYGTCLRLKTDVYVSIEEFLNFTSTYDFDSCDAQTKWVISTRSGLDSMLDDIIGQSLNCFIDGAELLDCH